MGGGRSKNKLQLDISRWKEFKISDLFVIKTGKDFIYSDAVGFDYAVIGQGSENNGLACKSEKLDDFELQNHKNTLSLAHIGNFASFVHPKDFYLGTRTKALILKEDNVNSKTLIFLSTILNKESFKYSYGRVGSDKFQKTSIKLPICYEEDGITPIIDKTNKYSKEGYIPDFKFMEDYIKSLPYGDRL